MDTAQWPQVIGVAKQVEEPRPITDQKRPRPQKEQALNCPRCNSTTTKFCYYNNYSLTQPRYFCKTCRRYWTQDGGTLRTVPVGGGSRKNKISISSSILSQAQSSSKKLLDHATSASVSRTAAPPNPITYDGQDLNLGYSLMTSYDQYNKRTYNSITGHIPRMRTLMDSNPQVREIIANPDFIRQLTSPETMQQVFPVQETLSQDGQQSTTQEAVPDNRGTGADVSRDEA